MQCIGPVLPTNYTADGNAAVNVSLAKKINTLNLSQAHGLTHQIFQYGIKRGNQFIFIAAANFEKRLFCKSKHAASGDGDLEIINRVNKILIEFLLSSGNQLIKTNFKTQVGLSGN